MSDTATEAKKIHQGLKELLKTREPYDKEIDFQRKNLRRRYLNLLLIHPYAKESKDAENHLWMQTSYAFIAVYKQRIANLDRQQSPVEYRKLLQRFRQFLAEEEKFWTQFVVRFCRTFSLDEAQPALVSLGILSTGTDGKVILDADAEADRGRNHFQFPTESLFDGVSDSQRQSRITILSKALICLGDIARYREQYNESGGRPKAGHEDVPGPSRRGRNKRAGSFSLDAIPRPRNYEKSKHCYEQARSLVPNEGNPSHQLAILANYQKDPFASLVHYYRALCVRLPYETASENMATVMTKTLEQWRRKEHTKDPLDVVPKVRIEALKEQQVVIHAIWHIGAEKMDSLARKALKNVHQEFFELVSDRHLPEDLIVNFIVLSQSALWKHRTRPPVPTQADSSRPLMSASLIEARMLSHVLSLHKCLLQVGIDQLKEPPPVDAAENDLAQRITAIFRRTLPALRIASKWLRVNYTYLMQRVGELKDDKHSIHEESIGIPAFWEAYAHFSRALSRAFPVDRLPTMSGPLDEDIEMRGFLPLQNMMQPEQGDVKTASKQDQVHPNVLQLMRISDLLADASSLVKMENSPLAIYGNLFMLKGVESILVSSSDQASGDDGLLRSIRDNRILNSMDEDELTELTSRTEDDPVRDAFRHLDSSDQAEEDEEDEIVYLRNPTSPDLVPAQAPLSPAKPVTAIPPKARLSDPLPAVPPIAPTTAQDLLNDMMRLSAGSPRTLNSGAPLLFGSEPRHSIWSAAQDEQSLRFSTGAISGHQTLTSEASIPSYNTSGMSRQLAALQQQPLQPLGGAHHRALSSGHAPNYAPFGTNEAYLYSSSISPSLAQSSNGLMNHDYITQSSAMYPHSSPGGNDPSFSGPQPMFAHSGISQVWGPGG